MKTKLIILLLSLFAQGMKAQESTTIVAQMKYISLVEEMTREGVLAKVGFTLNYGEMKEMNAYPEFTKYLDGQYVFEMAKFSAPYYRENCSIDELRLMKDYMTAPTMKAVFQKIVDNMSCSEDSLEKEWFSVLTDSRYGDTPPAVKLLKCSKAYRKALDELFSVMCLDKYAEGCAMAQTQIMTKSTLEEFEELMNKSDEDETKDDDDVDLSAITDGYNAIGKYLAKNMPTILRNIFIQNMSLEDIQTAIKIKDRKFYPAMKRATEAMYDDIPGYIQKTLDVSMAKFEEVIKSRKEKKEKKKKNTIPWPLSGKHQSHLQYASFFPEKA